MKCKQFIRTRNKKKDAIVTLLFPGVLKEVLQPPGVVKKVAVLNKSSIDDHCQRKKRGGLFC